VFGSRWALAALDEAIKSEVIVIAARR